MKCRLLSSCAEEANSCRGLRWHLRTDGMLLSTSQLPEASQSEASAPSGIRGLSSALNTSFSGEKFYFLGSDGWEG